MSELIARDDDTVEYTSAAEFEQAAESALADLGLTREELAQQARDGRFVSERARLTWFMISADVDSC